MRSKGTILFFILLILVVGLASCDFPEEECDVDDLVAPAAFSPVWETITTYEPILAWTYGSDCMADQFQVELSTSMGFSSATTVSATTTGGITNWTFPDPLEPATEYFWRIVAFKDGTMGPYSDVARFWTGPVCSPGSLLAPTLVSPADFGVGTVPWQPLVWDYSDTTCVPDYFEAQLRPAVDTTFSGPNMMDTPSAGTPATAQIPRDELEDCTGYMWRVRAVADGAEGPWSEVFHFNTDFDGTCEAESIYDYYPVCSTADLLSPIGIYPPSFSVVPDLIPSFSWAYPDLCFPEGYRIEVTTFGDYSDGTIAGGTGDADTVWSPASALEPATKYEWRVAPINGTTLGPYSPSLRFWTGPLCETTSLVAPVLMIPGNAYEVDTLTPMFHWEYPDACIPESYEFFLSTDPSFSSLEQYFNLGLPADTIILTEDYALTDCTIYFWQVRGFNIGGAGPVSTTFNFYTNATGACPSVAPEPVEELVCTPYLGRAACEEVGGEYYRVNDTVWLCICP